MTVSIVYSQDGTIDFTFGENGLAFFSHGNYQTRGEAIVELSDGSYIIAGNTYNHVSGSWQEQSFYVAKYTSTGEIDLSFGVDGVMFFPKGTNGNSSFGNMLKQLSGKILISALIDGQSVLMRINNEGVFDNSFGLNGLVEIERGGGLAMQTDDKIILTNQHYDGYNNYYLIKRYLNTGEIDITFGQGGSVFINPTANRFDLITKVHTQPDDKILLTGMSYTQIMPEKAIIVRLNPNGTLDDDFGNNGVVVNNFGNGQVDALFSDIKLQNNGKIVVVGNIYFQGGTGGFYGTKPLVVRYNTDGSFDTTFGDDGKLVFETVFNANDTFSDVLLQPDGKILIAGRASLSYPYMRTYFYMTRLTSGGDSDLNFGSNGIVLENFIEFTNDFSNQARDLLINSNGKIIAFGFTTNFTTPRKAFIVRFNNDLPMGIDDFLNKDLIVYPNPAKKYIIIKNLQVNSVSEIKLFDVLGKELPFVITKIENDEYFLDLSKFSSGLYYLKSQNFLKKIIKN
ncbi:MAG: T9SS type A sorting domain-containing protein [Flavobacteriales bacterium]|nr:T9SS type A sorting domain-containing protein [Flavobacteriales bacterium]